MSIAGLVLASVLTPATFGRAEAKALVEALGDEGQNGTAVADVEIVLQPDGHVASCAVVDSGGDSAIVERMCPKIMRFKVDGVARVDGEPAYGRFRTRMVVFDGSMPRMQPMAPNYTLTVAAMPKGTGPKVDVQIVAHVAADGQVLECAGVNGRLTGFYAAACGQLGPDLLKPVIDGAGTSVPYVAYMSMRFVGPDEAGSGVEK